MVSNCSWKTENSINEFNCIDELNERKSIIVKLESWLCQPLVNWTRTQFMLDGAPTPTQTPSCVSEHTIVYTMNSQYKYDNNNRETNNKTNETVYFFIIDTHKVTFQETIVLLFRQKQLGINPQSIKVRICEFLI